MHYYYPITCALAKNASWPACGSIVAFAYCSKSIFKLQQWLLPPRTTYLQISEWFGTILLGPCTHWSILPSAINPCMDVIQMQAHWFIQCSLTAHGNSCWLAWSATWLPTFRQLSYCHTRTPDYMCNTHLTNWPWAYLSRQGSYLIWTNLSRVWTSGWIVQKMARSFPPLGKWLNKWLSHAKEMICDNRNINRTPTHRTTLGRKPPYHLNLPKHMATYGSLLADLSVRTARQLLCL